MMGTRVNARGQPIRHQLYFLVLAAVLLDTLKQTIRQKLN